jgi:hypothetical protein
MAYGMSPSKLNKSILANVLGPVVKPRKSEQTRTHILEAALDFLWTHPFRDITVSELMSKTGAGRSAFYQYFGDLYELIETPLPGLEVAIFDVTTHWLHSEGGALVATRDVSFRHPTIATACKYFAAYPGPYHEIVGPTLPGALACVFLVNLAGWVVCAS